MPKEVVWSPLAETDLDNVLGYLAKKWSSKVAFMFLSRVESEINQIVKSPKLYPTINKKLRVRKCVINKQNTLFYRESPNRIEILRIYDTRQKPKTLKLR
ncbi:hypothetical protein CYCD_11180 [Tenuifilaceae bacterium CYCD]|nr:hypothetical protein CYCD_11180 [Tenuifilaceae bacterium CYCD]